MHPFLVLARLPDGDADRVRAGARASRRSLARAMRCWMLTAHWTASLTLSKAAKSPSPVCWISRPRDAASATRITARKRCLQASPASGPSRTTVSVEETRSANSTATRRGVVTVVQS
jgi:hypothetical protein